MLQGLTTSRSGTVLNSRRSGLPFQGGFALFHFRNRLKVRVVWKTKCFETVLRKSECFERVIWKPECFERVLWKPECFESQNGLKARRDSYQKCYESQKNGLKARTVSELEEIHIKIVFKIRLFSSTWRKSVSKLSPIMLWNHSKCQRSVWLEIRLIWPDSHVIHTRENILTLKQFRLPPVALLALKPSLLWSYSHR